MGFDGKRRKDGLVPMTVRIPKSETTTARGVEDEVEGKTEDLKGLSRSSSQLEISR
jgi:hypothetical protein